MSQPAFYHIVGVPLRSGSLYPGTENDAQAWRAARLPDRLHDAGCNVADEGDVDIPSYLPHHQVPPIRSWPGPRIAWECVDRRIAPLLERPDRVPLVIGCDCSVVVGTVQALRRASGQVHVLYIDGDCDAAAPDAARCQSAAALAVWLLTHDSPFCDGPPLPASNLTVIGWTTPSAPQPASTGWISLAGVRESGASAAARRALDRVPSSASILVHLDIDVFSERALPAAYFPHDQGLELAEGADLLRVILADPRVRLIEVSEYASLRDPARCHVGTLIDLLSKSLRK